MPVALPHHLSSRTSHLHFLVLLEPTCITTTTGSPLHYLTTYLHTSYVDSRTEHIQVASCPLNHPSQNHIKNLLLRSRQAGKPIQQAITICWCLFLGPPQVAVSVNIRRQGLLSPGMDWEAKMAWERSCPQGESLSPGKSQMAPDIALSCESHSDALSGRDNSHGNAADKHHSKPPGESDSVAT